MADINKFSLGKDGKFGEIDFNKIKSGLKESDLIKNNEQLKSVFNRIDKNGDGKLDREELNALQRLIAELSGDDNLSLKEAKKLEDEDGKLGRGGAKLLMELLNKMSETAKAQGIKKVETRTGGGIEVVTYEDGHTEEVYEDGSVITTVKDGGKTTKTHKDKNGNLLEETVLEDGVETHTTYADGKKVKEVQTKENSVETTNFDSEGNPKDKTVTDKESGVVDSYEYENGKFVLRKKVDSKNNSETVYSGDKETTTQTKDNTKTVTVKENGKLIRNTSTRKNENNETEMTDTVYDGNDYAENFYINDTIRRRKKVVDGNEYEVHYDSNGNTEGVIVQNGESIALLAKRFGCSVADLIKVNASKVRGKHPRVYFVVGEEIKIPGQMDVEDYTKIQAGRKSKAETVGDYKDYVARIEEEKRIKAEQEAAEAQKKADGVAAKKEQEQNIRNKEEAKAIAQEIYDACAEKVIGSIGRERFQKVLRSVNKNNVIDVLKAYKEIHPEESILELIADEKTSPVTSRKIATEHFANALYQKGIEVGVNKEELDKLLAEFKAEAKYQYITKVGAVDSAKLETILDAMLGAVIAKMQEAEEISDEEAIAQTTEMAKKDSKQASDNFNSAREDEGWIAKSSDWVCGLFGCKTIGEMREKVGKHSDEIMRLVNAKNIAEFKKIFKEVFGVEFDKQKIAAYNTAVENYEQAYAYKSVIEATDTLIQQGKGLPASEFKKLVKEKFGYTDAEINQFIASAGSDSGDEKVALINALKSLKNTFQNNYNGITKSSSLEDMAQDIELIKKSVFGTKDIAKEVDIFNSNMQLTEAIGTGAFEIIGTVALGFIPGGQGLAAARIAAMTAKYGKLAVTVTKAAKTAVQAGVATYAVLKTDGRSADEIKEHLKTNMAFAAGGVCSAAIAGKLAPMVAKTFKISGNVAKEVLEDAADMMASYVTSKGLGMEYGKTDAGIDMFMNFLMARLAHVQVGGKGAKAGSVSNKPDAGSSKHQSAAKSPDRTTSNGSAHSSEANVHHSTEKNVGEVPNPDGVPKTDKTASAPKVEETPIVDEAPKAEKKAGAPDIEETPKAEKGANTSDANKTPKTEEVPKAEKKADASKSEDAPKTEKASETKKTTSNAEELGIKLGKKLARSYKAIEKAIENMKNAVDFNKIYKRITVKFKDYADVATDLINKLKLKAKELGLKIEKQFDDIKTERANKKAQAESSKQANGAQGARRSAARGSIDFNEYSFYNFDDLKIRMADKFNLFSQNTQDMILNELAIKGSCRLQKYGIEYQFSVKNGVLRLEEFDINTKYNIKNGRIDEYTTQKTSNIESIDDIYWAISDELDLFSSKTQNYIMASLANGQGCVLRKYGMQFEFKIDRSGKITVTSFEYERFQNARAYQRSNGNQGANRSQGTSSAGNAQNYGRNMKPETRQAIEDLKDKIREKNTTIKALEDKIEYLNKKFVLPESKVKEYESILGLPANVKVTENSLKKAYNEKALKAHPDRGGNKETFQKIQEANEALKKHFGFGDTRRKIESETAEISQAIEDLQKEIAGYEDRINKLMNE